MIIAESLKHGIICSFVRRAGRSSNGRTSPSEGDYLGSSPSLPARLVKLLDLLFLYMYDSNRLQKVAEGTHVVHKGEL